ncbi:GNAT family N-acetyltransferase [Paenibacillus sp. FSL R7-0204]|uniref:Ribosomal protein S18 acetylase RimI-like enzyme n=1 Tax=Paenibacillus silagei TaxID=1670801 RepID=A0ABS4NNH2_9BACL|nr:GNAT family N-acetyltransferase [Paenibacillus silagei]MBP2111603.1 ribosomal protein S18 acetylase RimI-like enzyme [Paenibacillus silagei]
MNIIELDLTQNQQEISRLLEEHSRRMDSSIPPYQREVISLAAYENGVFIGGVTGDMVWNILNVHLLAVDPGYRGHGLGKALLEELEHRARQRGCKVSELTTMSWQAPFFYQKQGYEIFGEIKDCPHEGQSKYYLQKNLKPGSPS